MTKKIVIVGGGGSAEQFLQLSLLSEKENLLFGAEVWAINFVGCTLKCDKIIAMDYMEITRGAWPPHMKQYLERTQIPVISCAKVAGINIEEYPIKEVIEFFTGLSYFNTSVAYAVALAIYQGATDIGLYGIDFTWPGVINKEEAGRSCVEFWLGIAVQAGVKIHVAGTSTLLDTVSGRRLYGYADYLEKEKENKNERN